MRLHPTRNGHLLSRKREIVKSVNPRPLGRGLTLAPMSESEEELRRKLGAEVKRGTPHIHEIAPHEEWSSSLAEARDNNIL